MKIKTWNNKNINIDLPNAMAGNLIALPALIDPHVHFRTPGAEHKENWLTGAQAALAGGVTTVFDMPNNTPSVTSTSTLEQKKQLIDEQLKQSKIPLRYYLYFGATAENNDEIIKIRRSEDQKIISIKMFMGSSTGDLLVADRKKQEEIFKLATELNLVLAVHAEDETAIRLQTSDFSQPQVSDHSKIRDRKAAIIAVKNAIEMAKKYDTKLYICHVSTSEEIGLIRAIKHAGAKVYAEVTPHHLFLSENDYNRLGTLGQMNPPLRTTFDQKALWQAILDGTIDTIGTDHAPHTLAEKALPYPQSPSGVPGIETCLPLLLNAHNNGKISLEKIAELTRFNIQKIFNLPENNDKVIVDLNLEREVNNAELKTKCGWSPFAGWKLKGWPVATVIQNKTYLV